MGTENRMLHQKSQLILMAFCTVVVALFCGSSENALAVKPKPPLELQLNAAGQPDGKIEIKLTAIANMEIASAELSIKLPESLSLIQGGKKWSGPLSSGEKKIVTLLLQKISTTPEEVIGEGTVYFPEGGTFVQQSRIQINKDEETESPPLSPSIKQKKGRETILEFKSGNQ